MFSQVSFVQVAASICCLIFSVRATNVQRPNIVIVLADDLGWNDVSFHGSNQFHTPNIDALAYNGIILNSHYVPALCTPSRASFLTGKYPTSMGMQHLVILASEPWGLPLEETLMPQYFKRHGYATHAVGKWHLGFHQKEYTPLYRGFDTHFGYWNGYQDYYDHTMHAGPLQGYDMRRGLEVDYSCEGLYSTDIFTSEAVNIIENHNSTQGPLFLYFSHLAPHTGNPGNPFQAPEEEIAKHLHIKDPERRVYAAMVTKMDESLGKIMSALSKTRMLDNTIVLFMADNGGVTYGIHSNRASNYPLRGLKESPWEGGIRGTAAIWSPLLQKSKTVSNQMMHMSDWLPTLYSAAGFNTSELNGIDGMDMWHILSEGGESQRKEIFHNYDEIENYSALQVGAWKFVEGSTQEGAYDEWYGETGRDNDLNYDTSLIMNSETNSVIREYLKEDENTTSGFHQHITAELILKLRENSLVFCEYPTFSAYSLITGNHTKQPVESSESSFSFFALFEDHSQLAEAKEQIIEELESIYRKYPPLGELESEKFRFSPEEKSRLGDLVKAGKLEKLFKCDPMKTSCLFNLKFDPCERVNLAAVFREVLETLKIRLAELKKTVVKPLNQDEDPFSDPAYHNGTWANWRDVNQNGIRHLIMRITNFVRFSTPLNILLTSFTEDSSPEEMQRTSLNKWSAWFFGFGIIFIATMAAKRSSSSSKCIHEKTS